MLTFLQRPLKIDKTKVLETNCSLVYTYFIATNYSNGVGSQVLATLVTTLPLLYLIEDQVLPNALLEHSAILLVSKKQKSVLKTNSDLLFSGRLRQVLLYLKITV